SWLACSDIEKRYQELGTKSLYKQVHRKDTSTPATQQRIKFRILAMAPGLLESAAQPHTNILPTTILPPKQQPSTAIAEISTSSASPTSTLVLHPSLITKDFDLLRFEAAAFNQLATPTDPESQTNPPKTYSTDLISSPYNDPGHYLSLPTLPLPTALFAKALTALRPLLPTYATAPYTSALNFSHVLRELRHLVEQEREAGAAGLQHGWREQSFYVVVFRSRIRAASDREWVYRLDFESHAEACESGGLLKYWFGAEDEEGRNLATCFWHSRADAFQGGLGAWHKKARAAGRELYESIAFSTHRFTVFDGANEFGFEDWKE
ncbi:hypothetical protein J1614_003112, partial [Plenodomus biglobosus]